MDEHFPGYTQGIVDIFGSGDPVCCRWVIRWAGPDGGEALLRGVDVTTVRDGKNAEKLTYGTL
jgi:hypothetical protein